MAQWILRGLNTLAFRLSPAAPASERLKARRQIRDELIPLATALSGALEDPTIEAGPED